MCRELIHIYGPISVCGYGLMIFIGVLIFTYLIIKDQARPKILTREQFLDILVFGTVVALVGARILFILTNIDAFSHWYDLFAIWDGGLSILGATVAMLCVLPWYLRHYNIAVLPFLDLCAIYVPLLESIARIGCFLGGCCYGVATTMPWGITYHDLQADAPINICIHPTQLYSASALFIIFLMMQFGVRRYATIPGSLSFIFLILSACERFLIDFWRADREFFSFDHSHYLSVHQYIAAGLAIGSVIGLIIISQNRGKKQI